MKHEGSSPVQKNPPMTPVLNHVTPILIREHYFRNIHFNIIFWSKTISSEWSLPLQFFHTKILYAFLISPMHAERHAYFILKFN